MKEDFLHYLWKFKKFQVTNLRTTAGEDLVVISSGEYLQRSGPDFFNAQILLNGQKWAGNVEIHIKSSDWYLHHHHDDTGYENVILHVVWEHDTDVFRSDNTLIPVLEIKHYVAPDLVAGYRHLTTRKSWLFCEYHVREVSSFVMENWLERLFFERLERKARPVYELADETGRDWEAILFYLLAQNFGLNANGESFYNAARTVSYPVLRKEAGSSSNIEALLFGTVGLLSGEVEDNYARLLQDQYRYLARKYNLDADVHFPVEFFKHRPDNFPTIRLSQLSNLYHLRRNLFADVLSAKSITNFYNVFAIGTSEYWETHYRFDSLSPQKKKNLSRQFINLLLINTVLPLRFAYAKSRGEDDCALVMTIFTTLSPERNAIIDKFEASGVTARHAADSQALLQLKREYCDKGRCLHCAIGVESLKSSVLLTKSS